MASYTRYRDISVQGTGTNGSYAVGKKGSEVVVIAQAGTAVTVTGTVVVGETVTLAASFASSSAAQTVYVIAPCAGNITAAYCAADTANLSAAYTVKAGSAGNTAASVTQSTAASVAGFVTSMTLGTVAVTAGQSFSVARGVQGTTGASYVTIAIQRTS